MQALDTRGFIDKIDYLSTVSGGGYIGTSMTAKAPAPRPCHNARSNRTTLLRSSRAISCPGTWQERSRFEVRRLAFDLDRD